MLRLLLERVVGIERSIDDLRFVIPGMVQDAVDRRVEQLESRIPEIVSEITQSIRRQIVPEITQSVRRQIVPEITQSVRVEVDRAVRELKMSLMTVNNSLSQSTSVSHAQRTPIVLVDPNSVIVMEDDPFGKFLGSDLSTGGSAFLQHRLGIQSLVLESSEKLRTTGFAFIMWTNAWKALDALGIGDILRAKHNKLIGIVTTSVNSGVTTSELPFEAVYSPGRQETWCVKRKVLLETMENELPKGAIRYSSKVAHIENEGRFKSIHLSDGSIVKTKVLIACDGVNSVVAKHLGFSNPFFVGRSSIRGILHFEEPHGFEPKFMQFFGKGVRYGVIPCDDHVVYWFFAFSPSPTQENDLAEDPNKLKQLILSKLGKVPDKIKLVSAKTELANMVVSPLRSRYPWELLLKSICKDKVCVIGDALHPMTPDLGQGGCSALEDSVVLARCLAEAFKEKEASSDEENGQGARIQKGLEKFAEERKWRNFDLTSTSYVVGLMQQSDGVVMNFIRDNKMVAKFLAGLLLNKSSFDCGKLTGVS